MIAFFRPTGLFGIGWDKSDQQMHGLVLIQDLGEPIISGLEDSSDLSISQKPKHTRDCSSLYLPTDGLGINCFLGIASCVHSSFEIGLQYLASHG